MDDLKLCPICGGEPEFQHFNITPNVRGRIICSCGIEIMQGANDTEDDLRIIWNTRANEDTRWHQLFGTPERAALIAYKMSETCGVGCYGCPMEGVCDSYETLLEWLRGDAE